MSASDAVGPPLAVSVYGAPEQPATESVLLRDRSVLAFGSGAATPALTSSFETAAERLEALGRLYFEPDGSFAWTGTEPELWQIYGMLYDRDGRLQYVELRGRCPRDPWQRLLEALGAGDQPLAIHVLEAGVLVPADAFTAAWW